MRRCDQEIRCLTAVKRTPTEGLIDGHTHIGVDVLFYLRGYYPYAQDWPTLVSKGAENGISNFVVFPTVSNLSLNISDMQAGRISDVGGLESVPYAFENRRHMVEIERRFPELSQAALPLWLIDPSRKQTEQAQALRSLNDEFRCSGLKIQATVIESFVCDLLTSGEVLLDLAAEKNWPILIHTSINPIDIWSQVADILAVVKARPGIRFCLAHSCRFDEPGLEEVASLDNAWFDCSAHRIHCQLAVQNHPAVAAAGRRLVADYRDPAQVLALMAEKYPTKLIWGSDAPFESYVDDDFDLRSTYQQEADALHQLDLQVRMQIASANTQAFLGLSR